jgi:hypothetical protein
VTKKYGANMFNSYRLQSLLFVFVLFSIVACSKQDTLSPKPKEPENVPSIERLNIITFGTFPEQVNVIATGTFPDNCTTIDEITEKQSGNTLRFKIYTAHKTDKTCIKGREPYEEIIPLDLAGFSAGIYTVKVNNRKESFELIVDNP